MSSQPASPMAVAQDRARAWIVSGCLHLALVLVTGFLFSTQFLGAYPLGDSELLAPGRLRAVHTSALVFGFLASFLLGLWEHVAPRLLGRPVFSQKLGWAAFAGWQALVVAGYLAILSGGMQALEGGELPAAVGLGLVVALGAIATNFLQPVLASGAGALHPGLAYLGAALVWSVLNLAVGNLAPRLGVAGAAIASLYGNGVVSLLVIPLGLGLVHALFPEALGRSLWSRRLSLLGFFGLALVAPFQGASHYLWSPVPAGVQHASVVATVATQLAIAAIAWNLLATARGLGGEVWRSIPLRFVATGLIAAVVGCVQTATSVQPSAQAVVQFTDWYVAQRQLVLFGAAGFWCLGLSLLVWPKLVGASQLHSPGLAKAHWWLSLAGTALLWVDMSVAGLVEGFHWASLDLFSEGVRTAVPFWAVRSLAGALVSLGQVLYFVNLFATWREASAATPAPAPAPSPETASVPAPTAPAPAAGGLLERAPTVLVVAAASYAVALGTLGIQPFSSTGALKGNVVTPAAVPVDFAKYYKTPAEYKAALLAGRDAYIAENCWNCHTQFVRPVANESLRYGAVATLEESQNDLCFPQLLGTRRVGPDLSREHGKHSNDWHFAHLYDPRLVTPASVMPRFPWFFEKPAAAGEAPRPNARGVAVVAYLQWLGTESERLAHDGNTEKELMR